MSGNYQPTQARNTTCEAKQCEGNVWLIQVTKVQQVVIFRVSLQLFRFKVTSINMISIFLIRRKLKCCLMNSIFKHFWVRPNLGHKCGPQNLISLIIRLLYCNYKYFHTEPNGHHLPKYLYTYITSRNMQIWKGKLIPLSSKM